MIETKS